MKAVAVGLVAFVLLAVVAGYWVVASDHPTSTAPTPLFSYGQSGRFTYDAALAPNTLYNSTHLTNGNGTLFSSITDWVNVSFAFHLRIDTPVNATSIASVAVTLESAAWSKPLASQLVRATVEGGTAVALEVVYDLNVTNATKLVAAIEHETGYTPGAFSVVVTPNIHSVVAIGDAATGISFAPSLTLNFTADQIRPSGFVASDAGSFFAPGDPPVAGHSTASLLAYLLLFAALGGVIGLGYLAYETRETRAGPDLATLTRPYEEAIVDARVPPAAPNVVPVRAWEDVVKAADTLGSPIVRVVRPSVDGPGEPATTVFYVVSGTTAFVYSHGGRAGGGVPSPSEGSGRASPTISTRNLTAAVRDWQDRYPRIPGVDTASLDAFVAWSDRISDRLRWFRPSSSLRQDSEELLLRSIGLAQRGRLDAAWVILGQLYARLGPWDAPRNEPRSGASPAAPDRPPRTGAAPTSKPKG